MASVQTYGNGRIRISEDDKIVLEIMPRRTDSGRPAATIAVAGQTCELYERSLLALIEALRKVVQDDNHST